ncbi:MAG: hypothetical protein RQ826_10705 [Xanthomonadales bacterium]|nr:hypothetical protein [Xanthomonadales bacterium]
MKALKLSLLILSLALLAACAAKPAGETAAETSAPAVETVEDDFTWEGDGMDIPLDGSSVEAFETSLARVKKYVSADEYVSLQGAIEYLLVYDLSARGDLEKLAAKLDGLTPREVMKKVGWRGPKNKQPAASKTLNTV